MYMYVCMYMEVNQRKLQPESSVYTCTYCIYIYTHLYAYLNCNPLIDRKHGKLEIIRLFWKDPPYHPGNTFLSVFGTLSTYIDVYVNRIHNY